MDLDQYYNLVRYLDDISFTSHMTDTEKRQLQLKARHYFVRNGILYKRNRQHPDRPLTVVRVTEAETILYNMHSDPTAGHFAFDGTFQRTIARYFWPQMGQDIKEYIKACTTCQRFGGTKRKEPLHPIRVGQPFDRVGIDLVGPLPITTHGNRYIIVATEYLTKWPEAKAIPSKNAEHIAQFFYDDIICRHSCPKELLSDQGTEFCNQLVNALCNKHKVKHALSSAYHPQTNGLVERFNQTLCCALARTIDSSQQEWDELIPSVLLAYRTMKHTTTRHEPFFLLYGRSATLPIELEIPTYPTEPIDEADNVLRHVYRLITKLPDAWNKAKEAITNSQNYQKKRHDQKIITPDILKIGDKVWLQRKTREHKFAAKWLGPYYIHDILHNGAYRLRHLDSDEVLRHTYHGERLKQYLEYRPMEPQIIIE
jgi:hypothetical protein